MSPKAHNFRVSSFAEARRQKNNLTRQYYIYIYIPLHVQPLKLSISSSAQELTPVALLKTISRFHSISTKDGRLPRSPMRRRIVEMLGMPMAR